MTVDRPARRAFRMPSRLGADRSTPLGGVQSAPYRLARSWGALVGYPEVPGRRRGEELCWMPRYRPLRRCRRRWRARGVGAGRGRRVRRRRRGLRGSLQDPRPALADLTGRAAPSLRASRRRPRLARGHATARSGARPPSPSLTFACPAFHRPAPVRRLDLDAVPRGRRHRVPVDGGAARCGSSPTMTPDDRWTARRPRAAPRPRPLLDGLDPKGCPCSRGWRRSGGSSRRSTRVRRNARPRRDAGPRPGGGRAARRARAGRARRRLARERAAHARRTALERLRADLPRAARAGPDLQRDLPRAVAGARRTTHSWRGTAITMPRLRRVAARARAGAR